MPQRVIVSTGARLHFGLLANAVQPARQFGGVGLMVNQPGFQVQAETLEGAETGDTYSGDEIWRERLQEVVRRCRDAFPQAPPACRWTVQQSILPHVGLGSGTQFALAVAQAFSSLIGEPAVSSEDLARRAGRGLRSALGIHGFQQGGLIVEVGKRTRDQISPAASRIHWPDDWALLLVRPANIEGLSGAAESQAFLKLPPMNKALSARLCQIVLLELLPAVLEQDFETTGESLYQFSRLVGEYFAPVQGGTYSTPQLRNLARYLREQGVTGIGQTSWGPTGFVLCRGMAAAEQLAADLKSKEWGDCEITITTARNVGATVELP